MLAGRVTPVLAAEVARRLEIELVGCAPGQVPDGELRVVVDEQVRGAHVFIVRPACARPRRGRASLATREESRPAG